MNIKWKIMNINRWRAEMLCQLRVLVRCRDGWGVFHWGVCPQWYSFTSFISFTSWLHLSNSFFCWRLMQARFNPHSVLPFPARLYSPVLTWELNRGRVIATCNSDIRLHCQPCQQQMSKSWQFSTCWMMYEMRHIKILNQSGCYKVWWLNYRQQNLPIMQFIACTSPNTCIERAYNNLCWPQVERDESPRLIIYNMQIRDMCSVYACTYIFYTYEYNDRTHVRLTVSDHNAFCHTLCTNKHCTHYKLEHYTCIWTSHKHNSAIAYK
jgi:hypothetical protein